MKYTRQGSKGYEHKQSRDYVDIYSSDAPENNHTYVDIYSSERKKEKKKKRVSIAKILSVIFFLTLGCIGALMIYAYNTLNSFNYSDLSRPKNTERSPDRDISDLISDTMVLNVMLIGSDSMSVGDHGRSDSLMVLSLDLRNKKIKVTSLMRDIWVAIPGHGKDRLNAAYAYGGPALTIDTVERNFGILIDRYAIVDFEGFSQIIDILGGVDIELTSSECSYINTHCNDKHKLKGSGVKHLTGLQALNYSRDRDSAGSDYDRTKRQRTTINAMINKMKTANIAQIMELVSKIGPMVTTDFKTSEISRLATNALSYLNYPMVEFRLPTDDNVRNETYDQKMVLVINDMAKAKKDLTSFIYESSVDNLSKSV